MLKLVILSRAILLCTSLGMAMVACQGAPPPPRSNLPAIVLSTSQPSPGATPLPPESPSRPAALRTIPQAPRLQRALEARKIGDFAALRDELQVILAQEPPTSESQAARYYLAESLALQEQWDTAQKAFQEFLADPAPELKAPALFWLARSQEALADNAAAASPEMAMALATYQQYRALATPLAPYAALRQAALYEQLGQTAEAAKAYEEAAAFEFAPGARAGAYEKAIALNPPATALRLSEALLKLAQKPSYRAKVLKTAATLATEEGEATKAKVWLQEIITLAPASSEALQATELLLATADASLPKAAIAKVYYQAGRYEEALPYFDSAIQDGGPQSLEAQRLKALTLRALGQAETAMAELEALSKADQTGAVGLQAKLDWIQTLGQGGAMLEAAAAYQEFAGQHPTDSRAPIALDRAAQWFERAQKIDEAVQVHLILVQKYPQHDLATAAMNSTGAYLIRNGRFAEAEGAWQGYALQHQGKERARAAYKAAEAAENQQKRKEAQALYAVALEAAPFTYYGARAGDFLGLSPRAKEGKVALGEPLTTQDWQALEGWIRSWAGPTALTPLPSGETVRSAQRTILLEELALHREALEEWRQINGLWATAPAPNELLLLLHLAFEHDKPFIALRAAEKLAEIAPLEAHPIPLSLQRLIFPSPYASLVKQESKAFGLDPRLLYALIRQESTFLPQITSGAGAVGLTQVMPETAQHIAEQLGLEAYQTADLFKPKTNVHFGAYYLAQQIKMMEGSTLGGLAAYNGGPSNALRWAAGATALEPEQFVAQIDYSETKEYVQSTYGYYRAYQQLYHGP